MDKNLKISFNTFDSHVLEGRPEFELLLRNGVDYVFCHVDPARGSFADDCAKAARLAELLKSRGLDFAANFEFQNFAPETRTTDGFDWSNHPDGTHRLNLRPEFVEALASAGNLLAVGYDEFEHTIVNRNISLWLDSKGRVDKPVFPQLKTQDAVTQGEALAADLKAYADSVKAMGAPAFAGEHVFPVLYHTFARCGIIPNFKSQKESISNLQFAVAAGAALQYGTPLWNCVDMWHKMTFPGHSAEELYHNLLFSYLSGVDRAYVEADTALVKDGRVNEYGEAFLRFTGEYRGKDRGYNVQDYRPEIGILRYDDTYWGQNLVWARGLFGNRRIQPDARSREWLTILNTLTFGESFPHALTWSRIAPSSLKPHRSFCSMNALAVFDDRVRKETLSSLRLAFLCGLRISPETMRDVRELVRENGLTVVAPARFAPPELRGARGYTEQADGRGTWIVTDDFASPRLKERILPFMGAPGELRLPFRGREVRLALSEDRERFEVK